MIISSKLTFEATPLGESGHVLILTPFSVFVRVQFLTVTPMYWLFIMVSAKASYTNAMAWSAGYFLNVYLLAAIAKRDTIIPSFYGCARNIDHSWSTDMNPISVEAVFGCVDHNVLEGHIIAVQNVHVKQLAVQGRYPFYFWVGQLCEL